MAGPRPPADQFRPDGLPGRTGSDAHRRSLTAPTVRYAALAIAIVHSHVL